MKITTMLNALVKVSIELEGEQWWRNWDKRNRQYHNIRIGIIERWIRKEVELERQMEELRAMNREEEHE